MRRPRPQLDLGFKPLRKTAHQSDRARVLVWAGVSWLVLLVLILGSAPSYFERSNLKFLMLLPLIVVWSASASSLTLIWNRPRTNTVISVFMAFGLGLQLLNLRLTPLQYAYALLPGLFVLGLAWKSDRA